MREILLDFDGTLYPFDTTKSLEEVAAPGYSKTLTVIESMRYAIDRLIKEGYPIRLKSAVINNQAKKDKTECLKEVFGEAVASELLKGNPFVEYGESKIDGIDFSKEPILIDDFSSNLHEWEAAGGIGIKAYNGINGTKGTWKGFSIHSTSTPMVTYLSLKGILDVLDASKKIA